MTRALDEDSTPTAHFAKQVRRHRARLGWSQPQLAKQCQAVGLKWDRSVIANVEAGRRTAVGIHEVMALGRVFGVPPMLLVLPVGTQEMVEVLPGQLVDPWTAAQWFMGDVGAENFDPDSRLTGDLDEWRAATAPLHLSREHDRLKAEYLGTLIETQFTEDDPDSHARLQRDAGLFLRDLRSVRGEMRRHGMTPPALGDDLRHVDERRHVYLTPEQAAAHEAEHPGDLNPVDYRPRREA